MTTEAPKKIEYLQRQQVKYAGDATRYSFLGKFLAVESLIAAANATAVIARIAHAKIGELNLYTGNVGVNLSLSLLLAFGAVGCGIASGWANGERRIAQAGLQATSLLLQQERLQREFPDSK